MQMRYLILLIFIFSCTNQNLKSDIDIKVDELISKMTLREKVGQMTQINLTVIAKGPTKWASSFPMEIDEKKANIVKTYKFISDEDDPFNDRTTTIK